MWRAILASIMMWAGAAGAALSCENPDNISGIIFHDVPPSVAPSALVLDVEFDPDDVATWRGAPVVARVRRVVQGDYEGEFVRVGMPFFSSCTYPFVFGTEGLIIGALHEGVQVSVAEAYRYPDGARELHEIRTGFEGVWFSPMTESLIERRQRSGGER